MQTFFFSVEFGPLFRRLFLVLVVLFAFSSRAGAQVLFKKQSSSPASDYSAGGHPAGSDPWVVRSEQDSSGSPATQKPVFRVTYMGQPLETDLTGSAVFPSPGDSATTASGTTPGSDSATLAAFKSDSLMAVMLSDSLAQLRSLVPILEQSLWADSQRLGSNQADLNQMYRTIPSILPVSISSPAQLRVSSAYGQRVHPITGQLRNHAGIDLPQPRLTPVYSTADGIVDRIIWEPGGLGLAIFIAHASGYQTGYGHLEDHSVLVGQPVMRGQVIGRVGSTGLSTGPHLHYTVLAGRLPVDPAGYCFLLVNALNQRKRMNAKAGSGLSAKK